jgi:hypothetical protein
LVITDDPTLLRDHGKFERPPHGEGPLHLNPIYRVDRTEVGVKLLFELPSKWYAFENAEALSYHATGLRLSTAEFEAVTSGRRTTRTNELVRKYVLLDLPDRYARVPTS